MSNPNWLRLLLISAALSLLVTACTDDPDDYADGGMDATTDAADDDAGN